MNYYNISKAIMAGEKVNNIPLRVTFYARVSTDSEVQLNSLDNQLNYYENYIKNNNNWIFVKGYIDEGISGTRAIKRPSFMKMIKDAMIGKFDLIITKDVSRFARDIEDSVHYTRKLKEYGVGVLFENQSLNTFDFNSELTLNILYNLAQEESKKISSSVKFGFKKSIENGRVLGSSNITGYTKDKCKLLIDDDEALFVRRLFELYSTGNYGFYKLSKILASEGYFNKNNNPYDKSSLKRIIENPKYKGFYRSKTYETIDYRTKKRKKNDLNDQIIYKCDNSIIPSIVTEELWDKANIVLRQRTSKYKNNNNYSGSIKYPFSSKIYCKNHNTNYSRSSSNSIWACNKYLHSGLSYCSSPLILEKELMDIMLTIMREILIDNDDIVSNLLDLYNSIEKNNEYDIKLKQIENKIKNIEDKKTITLDLVFNKVIDNNSLKYQFNIFDKSIKELTNKKNKLLKYKYLYSKMKSNIKDLKHLIIKELDDGILEDFIRLFLSEIIVSKINNDRHNIKLDIYLNLINNESNIVKGSKHIDGPNNNDLLFVGNEIYIKKYKNNIIYNVYIESY